MLLCLEQQPEKASRSYPSRLTQRQRRKRLEGMNRKMQKKNAKGKGKKIMCSNNKKEYYW
jgi:hypothetical protein